MLFCQMKFVIVLCPKKRYTSAGEAKQVLNMGRKDQESASWEGEWQAERRAAAHGDAPGISLRVPSIGCSSERGRWPQAVVIGQERKNSFDSCGIACASTSTGAYRRAACLPNLHKFLATTRKETSIQRLKLKGCSCYFGFSR